MKKTIIITLTMLLCVAVTMAGISFVQQKQWTKPQTDDMNISVNSPVEDVQQQYKEYKWDYIYNMPGSGITKDNWNTIEAEITDDMVSFDEAGYAACKMLDEALPEYNIADNVFYGWIKEAYGFMLGAEVYRFLDSATVTADSMLRRTCDIDIHTGKCVQAIAANMEIYNMDEYGPYVKDEPLTEQQVYEIIEYSVDKCAVFEYSDFVSYKITRIPGYKTPKYWVYIYTEKDELLRVSILYTEDKIYFNDFCNEKMLGYGLDITELPDKIPPELL